MNKIFEFCARHSAKLTVGLLVLMVAFPFVFTSSYVLRIAITVLMYIVLSLSLNLLIGYLGQMSMGHAAFWGIGAYTAAILSTRLNFSSLETFLCAMVIAGLFGLLLGLPVLKLKGYYLTVVTLGFCEIVRLVELNWMDLTRGSLGISAIPPLNFFGQVFKSSRSVYFVALVLVILTIYVVHSIINSRVGLAILSIRDDEVAASSIGIHVFRYKVMVFIIAGMLAGLAGAFYAHYISFIDPSGFTTSASLDLVILAIFGGLGSIPGAILGTTILTVLPEVMRGLMEYRGMIYGVIIVVMMLVKPDGLLGSVNFKYIRQRLQMKAADKEKEAKA